MAQTAQTAVNPTMRTVIVLLACMVGILACAIYVAAKSPGRWRAETSLDEAKSQAEEVRKDAAQRIEALEHENADLRKQLDVAKADLDRGAGKLAAAEQEAVRLHGDLDAALQQMRRVESEICRR